MALVAGDLVMLSFRGLTFGQRIILTHTLEVTTSFPGATSVASDLDTIIDSVIVGGTNDILTKYLHCLPPQYTMTDIRAQRIKPVRSAYVARVLVATVGTNANDATVANDSGCITLRTALAGRDQVSNKHIGPIPDVVSANGLITNAFKGIMAELGDRLKTSFVALGLTAILTPVIWHRSNNSITPVTNYTIGDQSRVQRRRTVGLGE